MALLLQHPSHAAESASPPLLPKADAGRATGFLTRARQSRQRSRRRGTVAQSRCHSSRMQSSDGCGSSTPSSSTYSSSSARSGSSSTRSGSSSTRGGSSSTRSSSCCRSRTQKNSNTRNSRSRSNSSNCSSSRCSSSIQNSSWCVHHQDQSNRRSGGSGQDSFRAGQARSSNREGTCSCSSLLVKSVRPQSGSSSKYPRSRSTTDNYLNRTRSSSSSGPRDVYGYRSRSAGCCSRSVCRSEQRPSPRSTSSASLPRLIRSKSSWGSKGRSTCTPSRRTARAADGGRVRRGRGRPASGEAFLHCVLPSTAMQASSCDPLLTYAHCYRFPTATSLLLQLPSAATAAALSTYAVATEKQHLSAAAGACGGCHAAAADSASVSSSSVGACRVVVLRVGALPVLTVHRDLLPQLQQLLLPHVQSQTARATPASSAGDTQPMETHAKMLLLSASFCEPHERVSSRLLTSIFAACLAARPLAVATSTAAGGASPRCAEENLSTAFQCGAPVPTKDAAAAPVWSLAGAAAALGGQRAVAGASCSAAAAAAIRSLSSAARTSLSAAPAAACAAPADAAAADAAAAAPHALADAGPAGEDDAAARAATAADATAISAWLTEEGNCCAVVPGAFFFFLVRQQLRLPERMHFRLQLLGKELQPHTLVPLREVLQHRARPCQQRPQQQPAAPVELCAAESVSLQHFPRNCLEQKQSLQEAERGRGGEQHPERKSEEPEQPEKQRDAEQHHQQRCADEQQRRQQQEAEQLLKQERQNKGSSREDEEEDEHQQQVAVKQERQQHEQKEAHSEQLPTLHLLLSLSGGKGGFGALLKKQRKKQSRAALNFDMSRDLTGRRLRHAQLMDRLKAWLQRKAAEKRAVDLLGGSGEDAVSAQRTTEGRSRDRSAVAAARTAGETTAALDNAAPAVSLDASFLQNLRGNAEKMPALAAEGLHNRRRAQQEEQRQRRQTREQLLTAKQAAEQQQFYMLREVLQDDEGDDEGDSEDEEAADDGSSFAAARCMGTSQQTSSNSSSKGQASEQGTSQPSSRSKSGGGDAHNSRWWRSSNSKSGSSSSSSTSASSSSSSKVNSRSDKVASNDGNSSNIENGSSKVANYSGGSSKAGSRSVFRAGSAEQQQQQREGQLPRGRTAAAAAGRDAVFQLGSSVTASGAADSTRAGAAAGPTARNAAAEGHEAEAAAAAAAAQEQLAKAEEELRRKAEALEIASFSSAEELERAVDAEVMKKKLSLLGWKCGGRPRERAERLFLLKTLKGKDPPSHVLAGKSNSSRKKFYECTFPAS